MEATTSCGSCCSTGKHGNGFTKAGRKCCEVLGSADPFLLGTHASNSRHATSTASARAKAVLSGNRVKSSTGSSRHAPGSDERQSAIIRGARRLYKRRRAALIYGRAEGGRMQVIHSARRARRSGPSLNRNP